MADDVQILKEKLHISCKSKVNKDADILLAMIDELAERATSIHGQGLTLFMQTREEFINKVEHMREDYLTLLSPDTSSPFLCS